MKHRQGGFVMLAVIWVLLAMLAGVTLFSLWVHSSLEHAQQRQQQLNAQIAAQSLIDVALYMRLTSRPSAYGMSIPSGQAKVSEEDFLALFDMDDMGGLIVNHDKMAQAQTFPLDNRVWRFGDLNFIVQDTAGLLGFSDISHRYVARNLMKHGSFPFREQQLMDSYLDYVDEDSQRRMHGAEAFDYRVQQRAEPMNGALRTPLQLRDVMYWDDVLRSWSNGDLLYRLRVRGGSAVNINSASSEVLELILADANIAKELYYKRIERPFTNVFDAEALIKDESTGVQIQSGDGLRIWWWQEKSLTAWVYEYRYDAMIAGPKALQLDWSLRVDVPAVLQQQQAKSVEWGLLPQYPDYLGR